MIKIEFNNYQATISELGAQLTSLMNLATKFEYLWQGDPQYWHYQAPILFPFVGRLKDDQYKYQGQTFQQTQHGFAREKEFTVINQTDNMVEFELNSSRETLNVYPFKFRLNVTYLLDEQGLHVNYQVTNPSDQEPLLFALGAHPGFNVANSQFNQTKVTVKPNKQYQQIPLVGPYNDSGNPRRLDLQQPLKLSHDLFSHDAIILALNNQPVELTLARENSKRGLTVKIEGAPFVGIWSPYPQQAPLVCIEPWWGIADRLDADQQLDHKMAITHLPAGDTWHAGFSIQTF